VFRLLREERIPVQEVAEPPRFQAEALRPSGRATVLLQEADFGSAREVLQLDIPLECQDQRPEVLSREGKTEQNVQVLL